MLLNRECWLILNPFCFLAVGGDTELRSGERQPGDFRPGGSSSRQDSAGHLNRKGQKHDESGASSGESDPPPVAQGSGSDSGSTGVSSTTPGTTSSTRASSDVNSGGEALDSGSGELKWLVTRVCSA